MIFNIKNGMQGVVASVLVAVTSLSCNKLVHIPPPVTSITSSQVFSDSADMAAGINGIYSKIVNGGGGGISFCNGAQTVDLGIASDELVPYEATGDILNMYTNSLLSNNGIVTGTFWSAPYSGIYQANACIEGIQATKTVSDDAKNHFTGEAKFLRGLFYFYLVTLFGDVPYVTSTAWSQNALIPRTPKDEVYQQILLDLKDAKSLLPDDYSFATGQRTRPNKWAASALLSRVYLYTGDWADAETEATGIINNTSLFSLASDLNDVFSSTSSEAILQWELNTNFNNYNATSEGFTFLTGQDNPPSYFLSPQLLGSFETGDQRAVYWIDTVSYLGTSYLLPYKYKIGPYQYSPGASASEYLTVLRLAEQYLIRAEARAMQNNLQGAIDDVNVIRERAGLTGLNGVTDQPGALAAIMQERRIEFFAEWGHRWLDLKRTGSLDSVMQVVTPEKISGGVWNSHQQLFPIPQSERTADPKLTQNPGY